MDIHILETAVRHAGVLPSAIEDAVRRLQTHFAEQADPSPAIVAEQLTALRTAAPHLFPAQPTVSADGTPAGVAPAVWKGLTGSSKLAWLRAHGYAPAPADRGVKPVPVSPEQAAAYAAIKRPEDRLTAFRLAQAQQQKG